MALIANSDIKCRVCDSVGHKTHYEKVPGYYIDKNFDLLKCDNCNVIYTYPYLTPEETKSYYDTQTTAFNGSGSSDLIDEYIANKEDYWRRLNLESRLAVLKNNHREAKRTLDVGCGAGFYVDYLGSSGYQAEGLELSDWGIDAANRIGANVKQQRIGDIEGEQLYDVITMYDVLEHTHYPKQDLEKANNLLSSGGIIVVNLPNIGSLISKATSDRWNKLIPPNHTFHFTQETLARLAEDAGFKVVSLTTNNGSPSEFSGELAASVWRLPARYSSRIRRAYTKKDEPFSTSKDPFVGLIKVTQKTGRVLSPVAKHVVYPVLTRRNMGEGIQMVAIKP